MANTDSVALTHFKEEHMAVLSAFELPDEQVRYTSLPDQFKEVSEGQHRIVIVHNQEPVGFFVLHKTYRVKAYSGNPQAMLLTALSINRIHQGKGYGKEAMVLLKAFMNEEFPYCNEVVLAVNLKNTTARQLYDKAGFHDTGRRKMGPSGEQAIMALRL